jgi:hypothetical protein
MEVKILEITAAELRDALIREALKKELPSMQDNWRFNFAAQFKRLSNTKAYVLVTSAAPAIIEGCLIFQWLDKVVPYMAYIEIAPHNRGDNKKYDHVAGCLIAFAFKQTFKSSDSNYKGYLTFDVMEETKEETEKLMKNYSIRYNAKRIGLTKMAIIDEDGDNLIKKYLPESNTD